MKALFLAIRASDLDKVVSLVSRNRQLVHCIAQQPPKKDDGQSPLQVALKTGHFDIADYLIDMGADVQFIEQSSVNEWRAPAIHDAIRAAVFSSRFPGYGGILQNSEEQFQRALATLRKMIAHGARMDQVDSYGNTCLMRAAMDAVQLDLAPHHEELLADLSQVFEVLLEAGADVHESTQNRQSVFSLYKDKPVAQLLGVRR
ncbi:ankyrin repeat domain-containing protein [Paenibacillus sp. 1P07SE]|uniref:ankyrin repeat domain-containing protein n=1 Tax=Paenibacillus sp. 1P07SE TaxID=3132209 RepID=UPI0039A5388E